MSAVETWARNGHTVALYADLDCESPRDNDCLTGLFLGLPHRSYNIGDGQLDGQARYPCPDCPGASCELCGGDGEREPASLTELAAMLKAKYEARVILPVGMIDHSGVSYYIGGGAHPHDPGGWDSGTCGFIFDTPEKLAAAWGEQVPTEEQITQALTGEIEEYARWASGDCYGYAITDPNGDEVDSSWGFIGEEYATESANEVADGLQPPAAITLTITVTLAVDRAAWAEEYGIEPGAVTADVATYYSAGALREHHLAGHNLFGPLGVVTKVTIDIPAAESTARR